MHYNVTDEKGYDRGNCSPARARLEKDIAAAWSARAANMIDNASQLVRKYVGEAF